MNVLKRVPLPACVVALALASLGNLIQSHSEEARWVCGGVSAALLVLFLLKSLFLPGTLREDMGNPIMASVAGTFPMALMLLSAYAKPFAPEAAVYGWLFAVALHVLLIVYFTVKFMLPPALPKVFASYYVVYVGIAAAAVSAPAFGRTDIGTIAFWFGLVTFLLLTVLITMRYFKHRDVPPPARPLFCIYAAPASLCIAGYVQSVEPKSLTLLLALFAIACLLYLVALLKAVPLLRGQFFPSWAAFTFPFVISAIAAKQTMACAAKMGSPLPMPLMEYVVLFEVVVAAVLTLYVLLRFLTFIFGRP